MSASGGQQSTRPGSRRPNSRKVERHGGSATTRHKAEEALAAAKAKAAEPWAERVEGAKAAARDVDRRFRAYVTEHLAELVGGHEASGESAATRFNLACAELIAAHTEWLNVAAELSSTIAQVARPSPADVSRPLPQAEAAAASAIAVANAGGAVGPTLDRSRTPWDVLLGWVAVDDPVVDDLGPVPA